MTAPVRRRRPGPRRALTEDEILDAALRLPCGSSTIGHAPVDPRLIYKCGRWVVSLGTLSVGVVKAVTCGSPVAPVTVADRLAHARIAGTSHEGQSVVQRPRERKDACAGS
jgi:hypothetical protein